MSGDMTISEAISDPMIVQLLQADKVPLGAFVQLLQSAARVQLAQAERARLEAGLDLAAITANNEAAAISAA